MHSDSSFLITQRNGCMQEREQYWRFLSGALIIFSLKSMVLIYQNWFSDFLRIVIMVLKIHSDIYYSDCWRGFCSCL